MWILKLVIVAKHVKNHADTDKHKQIFYVSFIVFPSVQYF